MNYISRHRQEIVRKLVALMVIFVISIIFQSTEVGATSFNDITGQENTTNDTQEQENQVERETTVNESSNGALSDYIKNNNPLTDESMNKASKTTSPFVAFIGNLVGIGICCLLALQSLLTITDVIYISVPPFRDFLDGSRFGRKLITDEATGALIKCGIAVNQQGQQGMNNGGFGTGGFGTGGYGTGGYGAGGYGAGRFGNTGSFGVNNGMTGQDQQGQKPKKPLITYFMDRLVILIVLAICIIVLTSSLVMGCGVNIANLILGILAKFN